MLPKSSAFARGLASRARRGALLVFYKIPKKIFFQHDINNLITYRKITLGNINRSKIFKAALNFLNYINSNIAFIAMKPIAQ